MRDRVGVRVRAGVRRNAEGFGAENAREKVGARVIIEEAARNGVEKVS